ncbi:probable G-protein coupled receptor Mth-like 1 [Cloeon dipterum]|uniref:probable G-protein coupled receptor Mth-like 1 n=1 Tax=Cloeon dipterum TaxID=197152 RepID=UPI00322001BE
MKIGKFAILLVLGGLASGKDFCKEELQTTVEDANILNNGSLFTSAGDNYPKGTYWITATGLWKVCPCLSAQCIRICDKDYITSILKAYDNEKGVPLIPIPWKEVFGIDAPEVTPTDSLQRVHNAKCDGLAGFLDQEDFKILENGKLLKYRTETHDALHYCIHQVEGNAIYLLQCADDDVRYEETLPLRYSLYPPFFIFSCIFLIFTVLAYVYSPQHNSFHAKCVVFHSTCLAVFFVALSVDFLYDSVKNKGLCFFIGYTTFYFHLASVFWLNSMCVDVFCSFKGIVLTQTHFVISHLYSFGTPLVSVAVALHFNLIGGDSLLNSRLGESLCWLQESTALWLYFHGPILVLLLANTFLLFATYYTRRERTTDELTARKEQEQHEWRMECLILMLLACFDWISEVVSRTVEIWIFIDLFNASRGVLIFGILVCANRKMRKVLSDRLCKTTNNQAI